MDTAEQRARDEGEEWGSWEAWPVPRSGVEFLELEKQVLAAAGRQADAVLGSYLLRAHQDAEFVERATAAARARRDQPLRHKGMRVTSVRFPGGTVCQVHTPYLRPLRSGRRGAKRTGRGPTGVGVFPVLEALGMADGVSPAVRSQLSLYVIQAGSYQEAAVLLRERGLEVQPSTLLRVAQATAREDLALRKAALEAAFHTPVSPRGPLAGLRVRVSVDGGRVRTREPLSGRKTRHGRHRFETPWREPRMLVIDVLDAEGKSDALRLPLYDVLLDDAEATIDLVIGYLRMLGAAHAQVVEFIADGAEWIWERSEKVRREAEIPADRWVEVVDFYHASEHLHEVVELCRRVPRDERDEWYQALRHVLRRDPEGVEQVIETLHEEARGRGARAITQGIAYFEKHRARMAYAALDSRHLPVGSGPVESAIRRVINLRFKAASVFWREDIVDDLMHLRAAFKSGRWGETIARVLTHSWVVPSFARLSKRRIRAVMPPDEQEKEHLPQIALQCV